MATKKAKAKTSKKKSSSKNIVENKAPFMQFMSDKPVVEKKTTAKKKTAKKVAEKTAPATKRYFMLEIGGRGGEVIVGSSTKEFVDYWKGRDGELCDHLLSLTEVSDHLEYSPDDEDFEFPEGYDPDSPTPDGKKTLQPHFAYDDIEHETSVSSDSDYHSYSITEIKLDSDVEYVNGDIDWKDGITDDEDFDWYRDKFEQVKLISEDGQHSFNTTLYCRELFTESENSKADKPIPVVMSCDAQKGTFGRVFVETNGEDFDPSKLTIGVLENDMMDLVYEIFYGKQSLSVNTDNLNTWGKGFFATVGYMEKDFLKFNRKAWIKEGFKELGIK